jgi:microcystin degradation protein MlrC
MRNALGKDDKGCRLLRCVRAYVELDILASFDVHTDITIQLGRAAAARFFKLANVSQEFWT